MPTATEEQKSPEQLAAEKEVADLAPKIAETLFGAPTKTPDQLAKEKTAADAAAKKAKEEKTAADAKAKAEADKKAADEKAKAEAEKKAAGLRVQPAGQPQQTATPSADEIADRVAQRMAPKPETKGPELSEEDAKNREVLAFMAQESPERFGALLKRFDAFIPSEKAYREAWQKENPGKQYDPSDEAHSDFYSANDPIRTEEEQDAFNRSETRLEAKKEAERIVGEREGRRLHDEAIKSVGLRLQNHQRKIASEVLKQVDPELGKTDLSKKALRDVDPLAEAALRPYVPQVAAMTAELTKAFTPNLNYKFSDSNPLHVQIMQAIYGYENELLSLPADEQIANGRRLAPIEDYNKMLDAEKAKHWTIWMEPEAVKALLVRDAASKAKEDLALFRSKSSKSEPSTAGKDAQKAADEKAEKDKQDKAKKEFPNTNVGAESGAGSGSGDTIGPADAKTITTTLFGS